MARNKYLPALERVELWPELNVQPSGPETAAACLAETVVSSTSRLGGLLQVFVGVLERTRLLSSRDL